MEINKLVFLALMNCSELPNDSLTGIGEISTTSASSIFTIPTTSSTSTTSTTSNLDFGNEDQCILKRPVISLQLNGKDDLESANINISESCIVANVEKGVTLRLEFQCDKENYIIETWQPNALIFTSIEIGQQVNLNIFYYVEPFENYKFINITDKNGPVLVFMSAPYFPIDFMTYYPTSDFFNPLNISEKFNCEKCDESNGFIIDPCPCTNENSIHLKMINGLENDFQDITSFGTFKNLDFYVQYAEEINIDKCQNGPSDIPSDSFSGWIRFLGIRNAE